MIGTIRAEADERPAVRRRHDTPTQAGVEGDDTTGRNSTVERRKGEIEGGVTAGVQEGPVEAAHDPVGGSIVARDGDRRLADGETGVRNQVFERFLQPLGQTKLPMVFLVLMLLVVDFLQVWSATSLSTMSTRSILGGTYGRRGAPPLLSMGLRSFHPNRADQRSEEHTSELQSQSNLVCRLLLEKKKEASTGRS